MPKIAWLLCLGASWIVVEPVAAEPPSVKEVESALRRAVAFFRRNCSAGGGYVYRVSADLSKREGEGRVGPTTAWIQPPGTPEVGAACLEAYRWTGDPILLDAARETANALVRGQLESGGWDNRIEFDEEDRRRHAYRVETRGDPGRRRNVTTFDDDKSQSALRFLMRLDRQLDFSDRVLHEATKFALESFLRAQYANGAWPQRYSGAAGRETRPIVRARFPETWSRTFPKQAYGEFYTLNDGTLADLVETMLDAHDVYGDDRFLESAKRGGEFLLLARLPEPQPAWAQQYDHEMHPAWARRFEPPAVTGGESQGAVRTLLVLYRRTGDERFLEPVPRTLAYLRESLLPDGRLARFYELRTNRPLYFTRDYRLVYEDDDLPTHYGFKVGSKLDRLEDEYERLRRRRPEEAGDTRSVSNPRLSSSLTKRVQQLLQSLDDRGAWVEAGRLRYHGDTDDTTRVIESRTFSRNIVTLAQFIAASRRRESSR